MTGAVVLAVGLMPMTAQARPQVDDRPDGATAVARARVSADVLMQSYDEEKAWFPSSWWNSAVALQTVGDYMERTGDRRYLPQLDHTFERNKGTFPAGELSGDPLLGNFTSRAIDDAEWWGLTWIQAYDLTGEQKYLDMSETIAKYVHGFWDATGTCGGGVWWDAERTYKNSVTNGLYVRLTAELHNRIPGDTVWLSRAERGYDWLLSSGVINDDGLVNDGLNNDCENNGQTVWSYNQGLAIGASMEIYRATNDRRALATARRLATSALRSDALVDQGVLTESCDALDETCSDNGKQFKGVFMRYLMDLADTTNDRRYASFITTQARTVWDRDRDVAGRLGERWAGGTNDEYPNAFDWRTQASALSALIADVPKNAPSRSLSAAVSPAQPVVMPAKTGDTHVRLTVAVTATAPGRRPTRAHVKVSTPAGWTVMPGSSHVTLPARGDARPSTRTLTLDVTVPASAKVGHHLITADVSAPHHLSFTAQADVLIARTVDFVPGTAAETPWLLDADGSQTNGGESRFADRDSYFVYRFPFPQDTTSAKVALTIEAEYLVQASADGTHWTTVLKEDERVTDGSNKGEQTVDLTPYLTADKTAYLRVKDSFPDDGWGANVYRVASQLSSS